MHVHGCTIFQGEEEERKIERQGKKRDEKKERKRKDRGKKWMNGF